MVAKITCPFSIKRALNYNEKKVEKGVAECIHAANFLHDLDKLTFYRKLERFERLISLNQRAKTNTLHISLNFDPTEKFTKEKLVQIGQAYMQKIGFEEQPYLIYEHRDAGHPHIHIVTTNIQSTGKRINTFNIGKKLSEPARKEIERDFGLIQASRKQYKQASELALRPAERAVYGKSDTLRSITNVLDSVLNKYKYTSLAELNAVLKSYNVVADRGSESSRTYQKRGVYYHILDKDGNTTGVPIKASSIYSKPTLNYLEKRFATNLEKRKPDLEKLKGKIDWTLATKPVTLPQFLGMLNREKINVIINQTGDKRRSELIYIDHNTKAVFNSRDLGELYNADAIVQKCNNNLKASSLLFRCKLSTGSEPIKNYSDELLASDGDSVLNTLLTPIQQSEYLTSDFKKKKRRSKSQSKPNHQ